MENIEIMNFWGEEIPLPSSAPNRNTKLPTYLFAGVAIFVLTLIAINLYKSGRNKEKPGFDN